MYTIPCVAATESVRRVKLGGRLIPQLGILNSDGYTCVYIYIYVLYMYYMYTYVLPSQSLPF